jgi:MSHA biogenesis protein MshM
MQVNADLKNRITYSVNLLPLNDYDLEQFIQRELEIVKLGINTFDEGAIEVILGLLILTGRVVYKVGHVTLTYDCAHDKVISDRKRRLHSRNPILVQPAFFLHFKIYLCFNRKHNFT